MQPIGPTDARSVGKLGMDMAPGTYFDERWTCGLHLADQKSIPPDGSPPIASVSLGWLANEEHGTGEDHREEEDEEMHKAAGSEDGLPELIPQEHTKSRSEVEVNL